MSSEKLAALKDDFEELRESSEGERRIGALVAESEKQEGYLERWMELSREAKEVYPSQGLLETPYDFLDPVGMKKLDEGEIKETLMIRRFFLECFNHPYRIAFLDEVNAREFVAPAKVESLAMEEAIRSGMALSIGDLGASVVGDDKPRIGRSDRYAQGPFVKLGKQARVPLVGSESPDVWNSSSAIATMAASHCLTAIPRNGVLSEVRRQADVAIETFEWLERMAEEMLGERSDKDKILRYWMNNVMGTVEASPQKALIRAEALVEAGVRALRVYSPEPGTGGEETVRVLREKYGEEIEIFVGQIVSVEQAKRLMEYKVDGGVVGIGGGGRCLTGVRSGSVVDWPELVWRLRGEIDYPIIVQGGGSDHVAETLLLGASGIGVSRAVAGGTLESPGGALFYIDKNGRMFKPYGGEASARTKYLDGKLLPFKIPSFVEGETTKAEKSYVKFSYPTLSYNLHMKLEEVILALVFRGAASVDELHSLNPSPLRRSTQMGEFQRGTH